MMWAILLPILLALTKPVFPIVVMIAWQLVTILLFVAVHLWLISRRLIHVGHSPWFAFLALVPGANLWVGFHCLIAPAGYARHRTLDRSGLVLAGLCLLLAILALLSAVW